MPTGSPKRAWLFHLVEFVWRAALVILAGIACRGVAQDHLVQNWDLDEGLPSTSINAMIRTPDGYVWLGTQGGLVRFDGARFVTMNADVTPVLKSGPATSLALADDGGFWVGTANGQLVKHDGKTFSDLNVSHATQGKRIQSMALDGKGHLWLGTSGAGLIRVKDGSATALATLNERSPLWISQVVSDSQGKVWYRTESGMLGWVEGNQGPNLQLPDPMPGVIQTMARARDGGLWLAASDALHASARIFKFKDGQATEETEDYPWPSSLKRARATVLLEDDAGNLLCGTAGGGVFLRPAAGSWRAMASDLPLSQGEVLCLMRDEGETVWIGTRTSGLHQAVPRPLTAIHLSSSHKQSVLLTVCARRDGSVWGGTDSAGVFRWQDANATSNEESAGLAGIRVNALLEDSQTRLWAGTSAGLFELRDGGFKPCTRQELLENVGALYEDRRKNLWAGTPSGLVLVNGGTLESNDPRKGLPVGQVIAVAQDHAERFWVVVAGQGLFHEEGGRMTLWQPGKISKIMADRWANGRHARALLPDANGTLWVATYGSGLFRMQGNQLRCWFWKVDGLPSNHLLWLQNDGGGNLWASSENGIFGYAKNALLGYAGEGSPRPIPFRLTRAEGLPYKVCSGGGQPTGARSADGRLWFPDGPALVSFDPATAPQHSPTSPPMIEELRVDGAALPLSRNQPLRIQSGARSFEFLFTSPNFLTPGRLRFRHRLEGVDEHWSDEGNQRSVKYGTLPPGDYTFRVMTRESSEDWSGREAALRFTIAPRWWEMTSLRVAAMVALLGGTALIIRQAERNRDRRKLAAIERERTLERERSRIARDIHDDLGASLTQVALLGEMAGQTAGSPEELRSQTRQISEAAHEMARSLEAIVWAVRPENDTLRSLVEYMNRRTDELFENMPRQYQFITPAKLPECPVHAEVRHNVFLAYKETLNNTLKHAQASEVRIEVACDTTACRITVTDNGRGFDANSVRPGGSGLKNIRLRLDEIGGCADVQTRPDRGTTVRLEFPLNREAGQ